MSDLLKIILLIAFSAFPAAVSFAQKPKPRVSPPPAAAPAKLDLGKLSFNTYVNDYFGLKFEFPAGWLVGDNELEEQLKQISQAEIKANNPQMQKSLNQAADRVTVLLGGYKSLPGTPENASLRVAVEDLRASPQVKTGKDYFARLSATFKAAKLPDVFKYSEVKTETVDGLPLDYIETSSGNNKKRMYSTVRRGYAVLITISYYQDADFEALHRVLAEADLDYKN